MKRSKTTNQAPPHPDWAALVTALGQGREDDDGVLNEVWINGVKGVGSLPG